MHSQLILSCNFFLKNLGGTVVLYDRKVVRNFRKDGHNWKKKKDGKTVQEAHEKLKVICANNCCTLYYHNTSTIIGALSCLVDW